MITMNDETFFGWTKTRFSLTFFVDLSQPFIDVICTYNPFVELTQHLLFSFFVSFYFSIKKNNNFRSAKFYGTKFVPLNLLSCKTNTETFFFSKRWTQLCDAMRFIPFSYFRIDGICIIIMKFLYIYSSKRRTMPK